MPHPKAAVIQMTSGQDLHQNLSMTENLISQSAKLGASLVVLPEMFVLMGEGDAGKNRIAEDYGHGHIQDFLSRLAKQHHVWIVGGTMPIKKNNPNRTRAACVVYNDNGQQVARYDKTYLFDVCIKKGVEEYKESEATEPGDSDVVVIDTPIGRLGLAVCYDIRFPKIFQAMIDKGAEVIAVPAAFTVKTGKAHWDILTKARAIDNLCYGLFAGQVGRHTSNRETYGHSVIVNPWGETLASLGSEVGVAVADIDLEYLCHVRENLPIIQHRQAFKKD